MNTVSCISMAAAFAAAFIITALSEHWLIGLLKKLHLGQYVRDDGPETHLKKAGTPTMGGIGIIIAFAIACLIGGGINIRAQEVTDQYRFYFAHDLILIVFLSLSYAFAGFIDDILKEAKQESEGLKAWQKFMIQLLISVVFIILFIRWHKGLAIFNGATSIFIPFIHHPVVLPFVLFLIFMFFVLLGTDNGTNLTDGLDGLLSSVTIPVALFFIAIGFSDKVNAVPGSLSAVSVTGAAMLGCLLSFLIYNHHPARIFMGDTGSLCMGGFVAAASAVTHTELFIIVFGFVYLMETVSVILQVSYFKITHGKRLFRMAPIHHHFEKGGWKETKVVTVFTIVSCICCIAAYLLFIA
ncbi:MAG: phospho-N-acetylmuramoyl-pentapeptide-transferase [Lachnospiraceae bacterium]|nr:phospho-N-acetylmuramoyl-pentapeptide-transferase [Lachnospiraceae bacterium]